MPIVSIEDLKIDFPILPNQQRNDGYDQDDADSEEVDEDIDDRRIRHQDVFYSEEELEGLSRQSASVNTRNGSTSLFEAAVAYAMCGWTVVPIATEKRPAVKWPNYVHRKPTLDELRRWFNYWKGITGMAVITGKASNGLICRDFDTTESYDNWATLHPREAGTFPTTLTGRGYHVYCMCPDVTGDLFINDGELRAGGLVILPPSRHPSGHLYRWKIPPSVESPIRSVTRQDVRTFGWLTRRTRAAAKAAGTERTENTEKTEETELTEITEEINLISVDPDFEAIIRRCLPQREGERHEQIFDLAREIRTISRYRESDPRCFETILRRWHQLALPVIGTKPWEESWFSFLRGWPKIRHFKDELSVEAAAERARGVEVPEAVKYEDTKLRYLVAICRELQIQQGPDPFFLSCRTAGKLLDVSHHEANRWLQGLILEGILVVIEQGVPGGKKATRFKYRGQRPK